MSSGISQIAESNITIKPRRLYYLDWLLVLAILWFWAKKHAILKGPARTAADFQLVSYVFFLIAIWFLCGALSAPFEEALKDLLPSSPVAIMAFLVLGWLFLFLSHYKSAQAMQK